MKFSSMSALRTALALVLLTSTPCCIANSFQKWFYTRNFKNTEIESTQFHSSLISLQRILQLEDASDNTQSNFHIFNGGIVLHKQPYNASYDEYYHDVVGSEILGIHQDNFVHLNVSISKLQRFRMLLCDDYAALNRKLQADPNITLDDIMNDIVNAELGLFDMRYERLIRSEWREMAIGELVSVNFTLTYPSSHRQAHAGQSVPSNTATATVDGIQEATIGGDGDTVDEAKIDDAVQPELVTEQHFLVFTMDMMGRKSIYMHTWHKQQQKQQHSQSQSQSLSPKPPPAGTGVDDIGSVGGHVGDGGSESSIYTPIQNLRVMSFNLWHNNPPSWVYRDPSARWKRYERRLEHFADVVVAEDPDVIALQEVRLDGGFTAPDGKLQHCYNDSMNTADMGSQIEHVLSHLHRARQRVAANTVSADTASSTTDGDGDAGADAVRQFLAGRYYQVAYYPAMNMMNKHRLTVRNEEGVMMLSKLPILGVDTILLPRFMKDEEDSHQRAVLRVKVQAQTQAHREGNADHTGSISSAESDLLAVDVFTSHLSLSSNARDYAVNSFVDHIIQPYYNDQFSSPLSNIQVLTGDLNAEPHEDAIQFLQQPDNFIIKSPESLCGDNHAFIDAWNYTQQLQHLSQQQQHHQQAQQIDHEQGGAEAQAIVDGHTFPACQPVKRIDFVFVRNSSGNSEIDISACDCDICGKHVRSVYTQQQLEEDKQESFDGSVKLPAVKLFSRIVDFEILGSHPSADTAHLVGSREGLGMNDLDSPLWASDHFAVQAELQLLLLPKRRLSSNAELIAEARRLADMQAAVDSEQVDVVDDDGGEEKVDHNNSNSNGLDNSQRNEL